MHPMLNIAVKAARRAGNIIIRATRNLDIVAFKEKAVNDFVSEVDRDAEQAIIRTLRDAYPDHSILAEESGASGTSDFQWIIDPLDGTTNFAHGIPHFAVSIAGEDRGVIEFGVVYDPMRDELFAARRGEGTLLNETRQHVSATATLADSLLVTGFPYDLDRNPENNLNLYARLAMQSRGVRRLGSAALDLAYVAAARFDGYWELRLAPWDLAAGLLLVTEAGGVVSRVDGRPDPLRAPASVAASNGRIHVALLQALRQ